MLVVINSYMIFGKDGAENHAQYILCIHQSTMELRWIEAHTFPLIGRENFLIFEFIVG